MTSRAEPLRRRREALEAQAELERDRTVVGAIAAAEESNAIASMESRLAEELGRRHAGDVRLAQERRQICAQSTELRDLHRKLQEATVAKTRAAQIMEGSLRRGEEADRELELATHLEAQRMASLETLAARDAENAKMRGIVMNINQEQIARKEAARAEALEAHEEERRQVDAIVGRIEREDATEREAKAYQQAESRELLHRFRVEQEERTRATEEAERRELAEVEAYATAKREREEAAAAEKEALAEARRQAFYASMEKQAAKDKHAEELEFFRNELLMEEAEAEQRRRDEMQVRKRLEDRLEMLQAYEEQKAIAAQRRDETRRQEEQFRQQLLEQYAEDDRVEQLNAQRRRLKVEEHRREAERMVRARRDRYDAERRREVEEFDKDEAAEARRKSIIEEERARLLRQLADLKDFLGKGVFRSTGEMEEVYSGR